MRLGQHLAADVAQFNAQVVETAPGESSIAIGYLKAWRRTATPLAECLSYYMRNGVRNAEASERRGRVQLR